MLAVWSLLIISNIKLCVIFNPIPLSLLDILGAVNISLSLSGIVGLYINWYRPESGSLGQRIIATIVINCIVSVWPITWSHFLFLKLIVL